MNKDDPAAVMFSQLWYEIAPLAKRGLEFPDGGSLKFETFSGSFDRETETIRYSNSRTEECHCVEISSMGSPFSQYDEPRLRQLDEIAKKIWP